MKAYRRSIWNSAGWPLALVLALGLVLPLTGGVFAQGAPQSVVAVSAHDVSYRGAGGANLAGTLLLAHRAEQRVPGVVIIAGSGPTDRNGNSPLLGVNDDLYTQMATALADAGTATLRYDRRSIRRARGC